jgi:WD40 repeat protein
VDDKKKDWSYGTVKYSADGSKLLCCWRGTDAILLWSSENRSQVHRRLPTDPTMEAYAFSFDCDGAQMAALLQSKGDLAIVKYWDVNTGQEIKTLRISKDEIKTAVFAKNNSMLLTIHEWFTYVWKQDGDHFALSAKMFIDHVDQISTFGVSHSGDIFAVALCDDAIRFFDTHTGSKLAVYRGHTDRIHSLQFSPQGDSLVSSSIDGSLRLWDTTKQALSANMPHPTDGCLFHRIKFSSNGKYVAAIDAVLARVSVWNGETGIYLFTLTGHTDRVDAFAFSPDNSSLASISSDGTLRLWNTETDENNPWAVAHSQTTVPLKAVDMTFNAAGSLLSIFYHVGKSFVVKIYDVSGRDRTEIAVELFQSKPNDGVYPHLIRFSPDEPPVRVRYVRKEEKARVWDRTSDSVEEYDVDEDVHPTWIIPFQITSDDWIKSTKTGTLLVWLTRHRRTYIKCLGVHGNRLAFASRQGAMTLLDMSRLQRSEDW